MWRDTLQSVGISFATIFIVTFFLTGFNIFAAIIILLTVAMIIVDIGGLMYYWSIPLNAISLVNLVMVSSGRFRLQILPNPVMCLLQLITILLWFLGCWDRGRVLHSSYSWIYYFQVQHPDWSSQRQFSPHWNLCIHWDHAYKTWWNSLSWISQFSNLSGLLLPDVLGYCSFWGGSRSHFPTCPFVLHWSTVTTTKNRWGWRAT